MSSNKPKEINFKVSVDENAVPEKIEWDATDNPASSECKAAMITIWDKEELQQLRIDLWTKEMMVDEMKYFFHQNLMTMADTFERATNEGEMAREIREFGKHFAEKMELAPPMG